MQGLKSLQIKHRINRLAEQETDPGWHKIHILVGLRININDCLSYKEWRECGLLI